MKTYYLHTLDGQPAQFYDNIICFINDFGSAAPLALSLKQIRKEQRISAKTRKDRSNFMEFEVGYKRVCTP